MLKAEKMKLSNIISEPAHFPESPSSLILSLFVHFKNNYVNDCLILYVYLFVWHAQFEVHICSHVIFLHTQTGFALKEHSCCDMFSVDNMYQHKYKVTSFMRLPKFAARDHRLDIVCESSSGRRLT